MTGGERDAADEVDARSPLAGVQLPAPDVRAVMPPDDERLLDRAVMDGDRLGARVGVARDAVAVRSPGVAVQQRLEPDGRTTLLLHADAALVEQLHRRAFRRGPHERGALLGPERVGEERRHVDRGRAAEGEEPDRRHRDRREAGCKDDAQAMLDHATPP